MLSKVRGLLFTVFQRWELRPQSVLAGQLYPTASQNLIYPSIVDVSLGLQVNEAAPVFAT